jgi:hypothetical protein
LQSLSSVKWCVLVYSPDREYNLTHTHIHSKKLVLPARARPPKSCLFSKNLM